MFKKCGINILKFFDRQDFSPSLKTKCRFKNDAYITL